METKNRVPKIMRGAIIAHAVTAQTIHAPNVLVVCIIGLVLMESTKSDTLQLGKDVNFDGRSMKSGINIICNGVTARFIETDMVVMAGLNIEYKRAEVNPNVAKVERAGTGKIPPQNPTPKARPICDPESDLAGVINFSFIQVLMADISRDC